MTTEPIPYREFGDYTPLERVRVVAAAFDALPLRHEPAGAFGTFTGKTRPAHPAVTDALRVARFALDTHRDLPGVDTPWLEKEKTR